MMQTWLLVVFFIGAMACLPWLVKRLQQSQAMVNSAVGAMPKVLGAVAVGPQQKVVTVEVGHAGARTVLVLGVTAQQVTCLHVLAAAQETSSQVAPATFTQAMAALDASPTLKDGHG